MEYVAIVLVAIAVAVFISIPLFGDRRKLYGIEGAFEFDDSKRLNSLNLRRARIEENLRELEFEYRMGKLSERDYDSLRRDYTNELEDVTKALDRLKIGEEVQDLIEAEVRSRRRIK
jgi:hypothetical protein